MEFWAYKAHKIAPNFGTLFDIFIYEIVIFSSVKFDLRQILTHRPNGSVIGPIKMEFWANKTHKSAQNWGFRTLGHFYIYKCCFFIGSVGSN